MYKDRIIALFDVLEGFIALPSDQGDFYDSQDRLLYLCTDLTTGDEHHRYPAKSFCHNKKKRISIRLQSH